MRTEIAGKPSFAHIKLAMEPGETVRAESGAMVRRSPQIRPRAAFNGGFFTALLLKIFGGESLFVNWFTAEAPGELVLTQPAPGDVLELDLDGNELCLTEGALIAATEGVDIGVAWAGFASWIGGEGLFRLTVAGRGKVWLGGFGALVAVDVHSPLTIDTGHLVAYEPTISLRTRMSGSIFTSLAGGEGLVMEASGPGRVWLQTRNLDAFAGWISPYLPG
ncbi:MAG: TIGR00266 family protein [Deltaproteobacteria bacterium]|nr:TIGR00266 family protein [Deltaproteobacteria bacterium]